MSQTPDAETPEQIKAAMATPEGLCTRCSATGYCVEHHQKPKKLKPKKLAAALNARVRFKDQDPDEQFYPARCSDGTHHWHEDADAEGDTCNCGDWYRFADRIEKTPR